MIKVCPICKNEFKTSHSNQICCSRECDNKRKKVDRIELKCPICKKIFYKKASEIKNIKGEPCCCLECKHIYMQKYKFLDSKIENLPIYKVWNSMIQRCYNKKQKAFINYGNRGIVVCEDWKNFENFYNWAMKTNYKDGLSIERIDVNKNYCPENCKWIKVEEQAKNRRTSLWVEYNNQKMILKDVAILENIDYKSLWQIYKRKNDIYEAVRIAKLHKQGLNECNTSGVSGIGFYHNKWIVCYKKKYVGSYNTLEEAIKAKEEYKNRVN